jgi:hypothetical protein
MSHTLKSLLKISAAAASLSLVVGCASQANQDMQAQIDEAMQMASEAQSTADSANAKAELAQENANKALGDASDAQQTADSAKAMAEQNAKKIDRMFKDSMQK